MRCQRLCRRQIGGAVLLVEACRLFRLGKQSKLWCQRFTRVELAVMIRQILFWQPG